MTKPCTHPKWSMDHIKQCITCESCGKTSPIYTSPIKLLGLIKKKGKKSDEASKISRG